MSTTKSVKPDTIRVGDYIKFRVVSTKDISIYSGAVIGIADYTNARMYNTDLAALHQLMENGMSLIDAGRTLKPVTEQTFLIVRCMDGVIRPFAFEWVMTTIGTPEMVDKIEQGILYNIRIYDSTATDAAAAVQLLRNAGYVVKLTTV